MSHFGILVLVSPVICDCPADGDSSPHSSRCYYARDSGATVTLNRSFFVNIASNSEGGAVYCPILIAMDSCFRNCTSVPYNAGAIYVHSDGSSCSRLVGESCSAYSIGFLFSTGNNNNSFAKLQIFGCLAREAMGANDLFYSTLTSASNFTSCCAGTGLCGAIYCGTSPPSSSSISACFFANCSDGSDYASGGAVWAGSTSHLIVTASIFLDCSKGPGACLQDYSGFAELHFERCAFERSEFRQPPTGCAKPNVSKCLFDGAISAWVEDLGRNQAQTTAGSEIVDQVIVAGACDYFERGLVIDSPSAIFLSADTMHTKGAVSTDVAHSGGAPSNEAMQTGGPISVHAARTDRVPSLNAANPTGGYGLRESAPLELSAACASVTRWRSPYKIARIIIAISGLHWLLLWA